MGSYGTLEAQRLESTDRQSSSEHHWLQIWIWNRQWELTLHNRNFLALCVPPLRWLTSRPISVTSISLSLKRRLSSCFMDYTASALMCLFINYGCNFVPLSNLYLFKRRTASEERGKRKSVISCHTFYTFIA